MADVNTSIRKRKLSSQESGIETTAIDDDDDEGVGNSQLSEFELSEPDSKVMYLETKPSQDADSNLESLEPSVFNSQISVELVQDAVFLGAEHRVSELEAEVKRLETENEILKSKSCSCPKPRVTNEEVAVTVIFNDGEDFNFHKEKLVRFFEQIPEFCVSIEEDKLLIGVTKDKDVAANEWVVVDKEEIELLQSSTKKKKKPIEEIDAEDELFVVDTTPSLSVKRNLFYESKFSVINKPDAGENNKIESKSANSCFNCNENHSLRDCPEPKNYMKINAARQKFKTQQTKTLRYHLEDDQRFAHLQPGKISERLRKALGLKSNQLPEHIYRMRQLGYPPGWFTELQENRDSELVLFDFEGKHTFDQKMKVPDLDPDKIIEYPGFNVPLERGVKDEHRLYGCPPYSKEYCKENMLKYMQGIKKKAEDNLETCDMDIDHAPSDKEAEVVKPTNNHHSKDEERYQAKLLDEVRSANNSPTLGELESKKLKLLAELTEANSNSVSSGVLELETNETVNETIEEEAVYETVDITGEVDDLIDEVENTNSNTCDTQINIDNLNIVRTSCFGTPVLKSTSPYNRLPNPENFSQNVSQVINFENLPNSTGKYEQMVGVIEKVRKTLKGLSEQKT